MKIALTKIMSYLKEQKEAEKNMSPADKIVGNSAKPNNKSCFDNEQMLLHFYDILESIKLKFQKESISADDDLIINFGNQFISIEPGMVNFALAYEELNNTYKLEAITLIEEIILRIEDENPNLTKTTIINFFNEIIKEKKLQDEKEAFKRKIVWLKND